MFKPNDYRHHHCSWESFTNEQLALNHACEHVLHDIGWSRATITLYLERIADGAEGSMKYVADGDEWTVTLAEDES
jgi:hypothetical protein